MARTILAIDDSPVQQSLYKFFLSKDYALEQALSGNKALAIAKKIAFDLIITDINLPEMGGVDIIKNLKWMPHQVNAKILVVSSDLQGIKKAKAAGCDYFMIKPVDPHKLAKSIDKILNVAAAEQAKQAQDNNKSDGQQQAEEG